ncbi:hypothetical protein DEGR_02360 [Deinococcus grandis]|nr:hypothetical protein DEGR_02360 [Deinococcus grandis]
MRRRWARWSRAGVMAARRSLMRGGEVGEEVEGEVLGGLAAAEVGEGLGLFQGGGEGGGGRSQPMRRPAQ